MIRRAFVEAGGRRVHVRYAGAGAPMVMLHQSPRSSAELEPLIEAWAQDFLCIAPDTPGFGHSDPLPGNPGLDDFADALVATLDALGLERVGLYGAHTGAIIAVAAAARHPERFAALAAHGYAAWTAEERDDFVTHYLPRFRPEWTGAHLVWLWNRVREQRRFFPWHRPSDATRINWGEATAAELTEEALDFLRAGDHYRAGYGVAFESDAELPTRLRIPSLLVASRPDPLSEHLARLPALPAAVETRLVADWTAADDAARLFLVEHAAPPINFAPRRWTRERFVEVATPAWSGAIHAVMPNDAPTALVVHEPAGSAAVALLDAAPGDAAIDLPGHGLSDPLGDVALDGAGWATVIAAAVERLGLRAETLTLRLPGLARGLTEPLRAAGFADIASEQGAALVRQDMATRWLPDLSPDPSGVHLLRAWEAARDSQLFDPWYDSSPAGWRAVGDLAPERLAVRCLARLEAEGARALLAVCLGR